MTIGERIKDIRKKAGLTQKQLADRLGVTPSQVGQYERGLRSPGSLQVKKFADALSVPMDLLIADQLDEAAKSSHDNSTNRSYRQSIEIEQKLAHIGYSLGGDDDEGYLWINYEDGTLEVSDEDLATINEVCNKYLQFLLTDLKERNRAEFKTKKKSTSI